jgi:hypothetical protein
MWEMGGVHKTICQVPKMQENEILQQGMPEERLGFPPPLVCCCHSVTAPGVPSRALAMLENEERLFLKVYVKHHTITSHHIETASMHQRTME